MILLDPKLEPDPATASAARASRSARSIHRIPSARTLAQFLKVAHAAVRLRGKVSVLLTTDREIRRLNRDFRGIDKATDVLSFPAAEAMVGVAGDLAISVPTARRQAAELEHSLAVEIKVLTLHGLLHLAGYDHETDDGKMARRERLLRARLGLPQGLIERSTSAGMVRARLSRINKDAATVGRPDAAAKARRPSGPKAPLKKSGHMYGLKPVPFSPKHGSSAGPDAHLSLARVESGLRPGPTLRRGGKP